MLDTRPEEAFDELTALAAHICEAPIALISLVDENREWAKSQIGLRVSETVRDISFCGHAIHQSGLFIVPDAALDERFADNPLVTAEPRIRFYAGAPLVSPEGQALGTLCVIDHVPRELRPGQQESLRVLSRQVMTQLELRRRTRELARVQSEHDRLMKAEEEVREGERKYREMVEHANSIILRQSEEQFRSIMENLADLVAVLDLNGRRLYNSPSYGRILGDPEGLIGTCSFDEVHPEDRARVQRVFQETVLTGIGQRLEYRMMDQNGQARHIESQGTVIRDDRGQVSKVVVVSRDVTERKRAEEILRENETSYRFLFKHNPMPMLIYERVTLKMLAVNEAFLRHYGYSLEEALALRLTDLYPEEEKAKIAELITRLQGHANVGEWRHRKHDGSLITIVASSHDLVYKGRNARVAVMTDITERKRVEEELRAAQASLEERVLVRTTELAEAKERAESADRLKSAFLATMSHELRTPLNSIIGFTGILLQGLAGPLNAEQTKQLGMVQSSARHLLALINDVLDISKIEAGQLEIRAERFDLRTSLEKVAALVKPLAEKKGLALRVILSPDVEQAISDRLRVEQVLLNLLNNAVKFTERGEVTLEAALIKDHNFPNQGTPQSAARLCVTDTGIGIKPEDMEKIFQPFRQIDSSLTRQYEGTGLGLTICRRLAGLLGGEISAKSAWGEGSVFTFVLPLKHMSKR
ncbi:MAG: PAS domain S-box protein [Verrucomicrobiota bacterium]